MQKGAPSDRLCTRDPPQCDARSPLPHDSQPHHLSEQHDEVMLDSLEEGQLLEDDPYVSATMLKEVGRIWMEGLR